MSRLFPFALVPSTCSYGFQTLFPEPRDALPGPRRAAPPLSTRGTGPPPEIWMKKTALMLKRIIGKKRRWVQDSSRLSTPEAESGALLAAWPGSLLSHPLPGPRWDGCGWDPGAGGPLVVTFPGAAASFLLQQKTCLFPGKGGPQDVQPSALFRTPPVRSHQAGGLPAHRGSGRVPRRPESRRPRPPGSAAPMRP